MLLISKIIIFFTAALIFFVLLNIFLAGLTIISGKKFMPVGVYNSNGIIFIYIAAKAFIALKIMPRRLMRLIINLNNKLHFILNKNYKPKNLLLLLPRCLQNQSCVNAVAEAVSNCKQCGKCPISEIRDFKSNIEMNILVATGSEIAKEYVVKLKPDYVVAVACERELFTGIGEIRTIPVYAVLNEQPQGPCRNTKVDIAVLAKAVAAVR